MGDHFEHVGYRYRKEGESAEMWSYATLAEAGAMEEMASGGWQVERLYRRCEDASE